MRFLFTLLMIFLSLPSFGQNHFIGLQSGINLTNINTFNYLSDTDNKTGLNSGLTYQYHLNKRFNLGVDLLYFQRGFSNVIEFTDEFGNFTGASNISKDNFNYLALPLKGGMLIGNKLSGFVNLGIVPSVLVNLRFISPAVDGIIEELRYEETDGFTKFDLGGLLELGANYKIKADLLLFVSIGYHHSFTNIINQDNRSDSEIRHYGLALSIGSRYALKKE